MIQDKEVKLKLQKILVVSILNQIPKFKIDQPCHSQKIQLIQDKKIENKATIGEPTLPKKRPNKEICKNPNKGITNVFKLKDVKK